MQYSKSVSSKYMASNKQFWETIKPFYSKQNLYSDDHIVINDKNRIVNNEAKLAELFNIFFINSVENRMGKAPTSLGDFSYHQNDIDNVKKVISE